MGGGERKRKKRRLGQRGDKQIKGLLKFEYLFQKQKHFSFFLNEKQEGEKKEVLEK